jgi:hypothetical protein
MSLEDKLREQLPRGLRQIKILVMPHPDWEHLDWEPTLVIFYANGRSVPFQVDPEAGLTCVQIARLCVIPW